MLTKVAPILVWYFVSCPLNGCRPLQFFELFLTLRYPRAWQVDKLNWSHLDSLFVLNPKSGATPDLAISKYKQNLTYFELLVGM